MLTPQQEPVSGAASTSPHRETAPPDVWLADDVKRAINAHRAEDDAAMTEALHSLCSGARQAELPIERVLVQLKRAWQARAADAPLRTGPTDEHLARLVSACIAMYYRDG